MQLHITILLIFNLKLFNIVTFNNVKSIIRLHFCSLFSHIYQYYMRILFCIICSIGSTNNNNKDILFSCYILLEQTLAKDRVLN